MNYLIDKCDICINKYNTSQKKIVFGSSSIQYYKVCSPCKNSKPSTESLESNVRLSSTFYRGITVDSAPRPHGITVNVVLITECDDFEYCDVTTSMTSWSHSRDVIDDVTNRRAVVTFL